MTTGLRVSLLASCLLALGACAHSRDVAAAPEAAAEAPAGPAPQDPERTFSTEIGSLALEAQEHIDAGSHDLADALLDRALAMNPSEYERFMLLSMRGATNFQLDDLDAAVEDWLEAAALDVGRPDEDAAMRMNAGQLLIIDGRIDEGVALIEEWLRTFPQTGPRRANVVFMLANALAQDEQYERALPYAEQAAIEAESVERKHLDLLRFLYVKTGELAPPTL